MTRVYRLALATVITSLALIAIGGLARLQPAGSGCGNDWPRCNGSWLPSPGWAPIVEYAHRGAALTAVILAVLTALAAFRARDASRRVRLSAASGVGTIVLQSAIGGAAAGWGAPALVATLHLTAAMLFLACAVATLAAAATDRGAPRWLADLGRVPSAQADRPLAIAATLSAAVALLLVVFGATTSASGAFACAVWPLCGESGRGAQVETVIHLGYRSTALLGTMAATVMALLAWRRGASPLTRCLAAVALALVVAQTAVNALAMATGNPPWMSAPQLPVAALFWIVMLGLAAAAWTPHPAPAVRPSLAVIPPPTAHVQSVDPIGAAQAGSSTLVLATSPASLALDAILPALARTRQIVVDYVALTKPGIMTLLLTTTLCAMLMAARGVPPFWLVAVTILGGILASGGANTLNCFIDRDIDGQMTRTRNRPTPSGRVSPRATLLFGDALTVAAVLLLGLAVNWTAAMLAAAGNLFYVFVYTKWLKRATPYNIVIGGAAGAAPPLVGWAAVTGNLTPLAWGLFAIIFAWTPPHFWALALLKQGEYTRAAVPMLPVVRGERETRRQILLYTVALAVVSLALTPLGLGGIYLAAALVLNGIFLWLAVWLYHHPSKRVARLMFFYSLWYLALLFAAAVIDRIFIA
jgi:protoheme IX farnesyltransferase